MKEKSNNEKQHLMEFTKNLRQGKAQEAMKVLEKVVKIKQGKRLEEVQQSL